MSPGANRTVEVRLTERPTDARWGLPPGLAPPPGHTGVLGWVTRAPSVDAGVPADAAALLAGALCHAGKITFLSSTRAAAAGPAWAPVASGFARRLAPGPLDRLRGEPPFPLFCTEDPAAAGELFCDPRFPWEQGGQLAVLSPSDAAPPSLDRSAVRDTLAVRSHALSAQGASGVVLPGPDGDFARILAFDEGAWARLHEGLAAEGARAGVPFRIVPEAEFNDTSWYREEH